MKQFEKRMAVFNEISYGQSEIFQLANFAFSAGMLGT